MRKTNHLTAILTMLVLAIFASGTAQAINILWVDSATTSGGAGVAPSAAWLNLLQTTGGHSVTTFDGNTHNWNLSTQADKDYVNSFDLIVITRSNEIFNTIRTHGAVWNSQPTPMINTNMYFASGQFSAGSWNWLASGTGGAPGVSNGTTAFDIANPADPIWNGVGLVNGGTQAPDLVEASRYFDTNGNPLKAGVSPVAWDPADSNNLVVAFAAAGSLRPGGGPQYFIAGHTNNSSEALTAAGEQVFLNAINALVPTTAAVPEPATASLGLIALGGLLVRRRR